nr:integrase domain-containing protein [Gilliamella apicola]
MAAIRATLTQAGQEKLAQSERLTNQALNIAHVSRMGTKTVISEQQYQTILHTALQKDQGLTATIQLARALGLRSEEAVQSIHSLNTWQTALNQGKTTLPIIFGTKGGRPRETRIINPERVKQAVDFAIKVSKQQRGKLINKPNLKQAMTY